MSSASLRPQKLSSVWPWVQGIAILDDAVNSAKLVKVGAGARTIASQVTPSTRSSDFAFYSLAAAWFTAVRKNADADPLLAALATQIGQHVKRSIRDNNPNTIIRAYAASVVVTQAIRAVIKADPEVHAPLQPFLDAMQNQIQEYLCVDETRSGFLVIALGGAPLEIVYAALLSASAETDFAPTLEKFEHVTRAIQEEIDVNGVGLWPVLCMHIQRELVRLAEADGVGGLSQALRQTRNSLIIAEDFLAGCSQTLGRIPTLNLRFSAMWVDEVRTAFSHRYLQVLDLESAENKPPAEQAQAPPKKTAEYETRILELTEKYAAGEMDIDALTQALGSF